jgi:hypothetical protein
MARAVGVSVSSVQRIWQAHGLQPHRVRRFKLSKDPEFVPKLREIVGLYVNPAAHAIVLSVDEKSQIQALDRTQPGLPMKKGRAGTLTHDYKRHGTTTLFAALDVLEGKVIGRCMQRHRHQEFIRFLNAIEAEIPVGKIIHVVLDNYATHKHPKVRAWLVRHPRFVFHFTPKSRSWLNAVETLFSRLTRRRLKRGVFRPAPPYRRQPPPEPAPAGPIDRVECRVHLLRTLRPCRWMLPPAPVPAIMGSIMGSADSPPDGNGKHVGARIAAGCFPFASHLRVRVGIDDLSLWKIWWARQGLNL